MSEQPEFSFPPKKESPSQIPLNEMGAAEIVYNYPEKELLKKYEELVGLRFSNSYFSGNEEEREFQLIAVLQNPDSERKRIETLYSEEAYEENTRTNRGTPDPRMTPLSLSSDKGFGQYHKTSL